MITLEWILGISVLFLVAILVVFGICCGIYLVIDTICVIRDKIKELKERETK